MKRETFLINRGGEMIKRLKNSDKKFMEIFFLTEFEPRIHEIIDSYQIDRGLKFLNVDGLYKECEKKVKEILEKIRLNKIMIKEDLSSYIDSAIKNVIRDQGREERARKNRIRKKSNSIYNKKIKSKKDIPGEIWESIYRSLKYIARLYKTKEKLKSDPIPKIVNILSSAREDLYCLGKNKEFENLKKSRPYQDQLESIDKQINKWLEYPEGLNFDNSIYYLCPLGPKKINKSGKFVTFQSAYVLENILSLRIKPIRLMFEVWKKHKELKKGEILDRELILRVFRDLKKKTKDLDLSFAFLFESINENDFKNPASAIKFFENIRKSTYSNPNNAKFYNELIESIYQVSFIEKIEPDDLEKIIKYHIESKIFQLRHYQDLKFPEYIGLPID